MGGVADRDISGVRKNSNSSKRQNHLSGEVLFNFGKRGDL